MRHVKLALYFIATSALASPDRWTVSQIGWAHHRHLQWLVGQPEGQRADLVGVNWEGVILTHAWLERASLVRINLNHAFLWASDFSGADLREANLSSADLRRTKFVGADLRGANLSGANCDKADFRGADLTGAKLKRVKNWPVDEVEWVPVGPEAMGLTQAYPEIPHHTTTFYYDSPQAAGLP
jgi:uncharacterized protein YjbI with pentapeptide repeats